MAYSKILAALNMSDEELERQTRQAQRSERARVKEQERHDHDTGFYAGGPIDESASWHYKAGQQARNETILDVDMDAWQSEGKLHVEEERPSFLKRIFG